MTRLADVTFIIETVFNPDGTYTAIARGTVSGRIHTLTDTRASLIDALHGINQRILELLAPF